MKHKVIRKSVRAFAEAEVAAENATGGAQRWVIIH